MFTRLFTLSILFLSILLVAGCASTQPKSEQAQTKDYVYVTNQMEATVSVIDTETLTEVHRVDLKSMGFSANAKPHHVAVEPDGSYWYVSLIGEHKILKFNRNNELIDQTSGFETPGMLVMDPKNDALYVGRSMSAVNPPKSIGVIKRSDMSVDRVDTFFPRPHAITLNPVTNFIYTASLAENRVLTYNQEEESSDLMDLDGNLHMLVQFAISPDGKTMVAGGQMSGAFLIFDITKPNHPQLIKSLDIGHQPWHPTFTPNGKYVYIPNKTANSVTVVDMEKQEVAKVITGNGLSEPHGIGATPNGKYIFISNNNKKGAYKSAKMPDHKMGTVVVINTDTQTIEKVIEVGMSPTGVGIRPIQ